MNVFEAPFMQQNTIEHLEENRLTVPFDML